jgi:hypothetical protein
MPCVTLLVVLLRVIAYERASWEREREKERERERIGLKAAWITDIPRCMAMPANIIVRGYKTRTKTKSKFLLYFIPKGIVHCSPPTKKKEKKKKWKKRERTGSKRQRERGIQGERVVKERNWGKEGEGRDRVLW